MHGSHAPARRIIAVKSGGEAAIPDWQACFAELAPHLEVRWWDDPQVAPEDVDYVIVWQPEPGRLAAYPNLRLILSSAAGTDHITSDPSWPRHLPIVRAVTPEASQRMAEFIVMSTLALMRDLKRAIIGQHQRVWDNFEVDRCAWDMRVGILGLGSMGAASARMLRSVGFGVSGWSRSQKAIEGVTCHAGREGLDAFLKETDILVCLLPNTPETTGLINADLLAKLPAGAGLINAGRGTHMMLGDVLSALDSGQLSGAVLDVFEEEPLPTDNPAWTHPKVIVTPHIGSIASRRARAAFYAEQIRRFEAGEPMDALYDPVAGY